MAQLDFYATMQESFKFLESLTQQMQVVMIADVWYHSKNPHVYTQVSGPLKEDLAVKRRLFIAQDFNSLRVDQGLVEQTSGPRAGWYSVRPRMVGEVLELTLPACFEKNEITWFSCGSLFCASDFLNADGDGVSPSQKHREFYQSVRILLKNDLEKAIVNGRKCLIAADALAMVKAGSARIADTG